mmetsp:Transcript_38547/g.109000  ORF Transcript_38547/g.109000 Transcript_38547/m.109000 type:complete len:157 (-) Transcript_38547:117-587(-)|eukprot:CAMPEP_0117684796 /NCGR_PEP_ID=MMETSP0804-20121206/21332_1 /TAXON_ID=1074897 /ORGANISM="Tetraselmis astigmatica, Strain CCMP880" /LENGTH=156 /DNA_ID=CAMNT_0005495895 /DNA_START=556 /DNA_END=1026 /DNA_ORIENTATION=+
MEHKGGLSQKDIEDTFGCNMKKRLRVLHLPMLYKPAAKIGTVFRTCAILHNMLLDFNGMSSIGQEEWQWIELGNRETIAEMAQQGVGGPATQGRGGYTCLTTHFNPLGRPAVEDKRRHHGMKDVLLQHFTFLKAANKLIWLQLDPIGTFSNDSSDT